MTHFNVEDSLWLNRCTFGYSPVTLGLGYLQRINTVSTPNHFDDGKTNRVCFLLIIRISTYTVRKSTCRNTSRIPFVLNKYFSMIYLEFTSLSFQCFFYTRKSVINRHVSLLTFFVTCFLAVYRLVPVLLFMTKVKKLLYFKKKTRSVSGHNQVIIHFT